MRRGQVFKPVRMARALGAIVLAIGRGQGALAQAPYPSKPVWVIPPLGSGGAVEIMGRLVTRKMSESVKDKSDKSGQVHICRKCEPGPIFPTSGFRRAPLAARRPASRCSAACRP